eukprot:5290125-Karenia_brevis.AAC.1
MVEVPIAQIKTRLQQMELDMFKLWDDVAQDYRLHSEFVPPRPTPTQYLAYEQLKFRFDAQEALFVCLVAPA